MIIRTIEADLGTWKIEHDEPRKRWLLKFKKAGQAQWTPVDIHDSEEAAAEAVGSGDTGVAEWDGRTHKKEAFALPHWKPGDE